MRQNLQETADLVKFTEEILDGKLHFFVQCVSQKFTELDFEVGYFFIRTSKHSLCSNFFRVFKLTMFLFCSDFL